MTHFRRKDLSPHRKKATVKAGGFTIELEGFTDICDIAKLVAALNASGQNNPDISVTYDAPNSTDAEVYYLHSGLRI